MDNNRIHTKTVSLWTQFQAWIKASQVGHGENGCVCITTNLQKCLIQFIDKLDLELD